MSEVELYAVEAKFNEAKTKYITLMNSLQTSCLGDQRNAQCQTAEELNASMQTYLIQMSNLLKKKATHLPKQQELLNVAGQLELDKDQLDTEYAARQDIQVIANMNHAKWLAWFLAAITVFCIVMYTQK
jgi:hypothetical protein